MSVRIGGLIEDEPPQVQPTFQEYPKVMVHPHAFKAATNTDAMGNQIGTTVAPADRFPPVTVLNPDQEAWHKSQGYVAGGSSSVEAFNRTVAGTAVAETARFVEWPKWVDGVLYKSEQDYRTRARAFTAPESAAAATTPPDAAAVRRKGNPDGLAKARAARAAKKAARQ